MENRNYTIKDIARMAGVSAGTVDRVLHNRGDVSENSRQKVQKVLDEIDYQPNVFAIGLAAKKPYRLICLIPFYQEESYWYAVSQGIDRAAKELRPFNVTIDYLCYNHADLCSYESCCQQIITEQVDGVLIAANFKDETLALTTRLDEKSIPYIFIDVNVEQAHAISYIGQDSHVSGYIAAKMLMRNCESDEEVVIFLNSRKKDSPEIQMQRRMEGFLSYLKEKEISIPIHEIVLENNNPDANRNTLHHFFTHHPKAVWGVGFNSRIYQVAAYLQEIKQNMKGLVGYDLLQKNIEYLKSGEVDWLIGQRPALQGYCGVKSLTDYIVFKKPVTPIQYMPIDILMKENVEYQWKLDN